MAYGKSCIQSFQRDLKGNVALTFAIALLPVTATLGFSVDMHRQNNARDFGQHVIDAAVLAATREYVATSNLPTAKRLAAADAAGKKYIAVNKVRGAKNVSFSNVKFNVNTTKQVVTGSADVAVPATLSTMFGKTSMKAHVDASASAGDTRRFEFVLALDVTTSMFTNSRMVKMRSAAQTFVDIMFDATPSNNLTRVGVVPWAATVNINSERPKKWNAAKVSVGSVPAAGSQKIPNAAFEDRTKYLQNRYYGSLSKSDLSDLFDPVEWRGCIRAANGERVVNPSGKVTKKLTDNASSMKWPVGNVPSEMRQQWVDTSPPKPSPKPSPSTSPKPSPKPAPKPTPKPKPKPSVPGLGSDASDYLEFDQERDWAAFLPENETGVTQVRASYFKGNVAHCSQSSWQDSIEGGRNAYISKTQDCTTNWKKKKTGTIQECVADANEFAYIKSGKKLCSWQTNAVPLDAPKPTLGPNLNCPAAMMGMSGDRSQIMDKLNELYPVSGGTQADVGLMWALRMLSPNTKWNSFFGYQSADFLPGSYTDPTVKKAIVLLTDGENMAPYHFEGYYGCNETGTRGSAGNCWKSSTVKSLTRDSLDDLMKDACDTIRDDYDIEIFTIAVEVTDSNAKKLLKQCAGDPENFFDVNSGDLEETFVTLAKRAIRLIE